MTKITYKSVEEYIAAQPDAVAAMLTLVRNTILMALPAADESISYNMPTYTLRGETVLYFAGWKRHYSLYRATAPLLEAFRGELAPYKVDRGTISFPLSKPVPVKLIANIAKFRANEVFQGKKRR